MCTPTEAFPHWLLANQRGGYYLRRWVNWGWEKLSHLVFSEARSCRKVCTCSVCFLSKLWSLERTSLLHCTSCLLSLGCPSSRQPSTCTCQLLHGHKDPGSWRDRSVGGTFPVIFFPPHICFLFPATLITKGLGPNSSLMPLFSWRYIFEKEDQQMMFWSSNMLVLFWKKKNHESALLVLLSTLTQKEPLPLNVHEWVSATFAAWYYLLDMFLKNR